ncbi:MAG: hypothetical protein Q8P41_10145 [Pseudomonadota bacterium]|nr:hypothetical protein [Pseudomonadota bacterium]
MDHRCLFGHRVPATFTFAIQSRSCPTCGAPTVTITGYQAARKLTTDAGLEAVAAFNAVRVLESEWVLMPANGEPAAAPTPGPALAADPVVPTAALSVAAAPQDEDEVVVEDVAEPAPVVLATVVPATVPEPRIVAAPAPAPAAKAEEPVKSGPRPLSRPEPRIVAAPVVAEKSVSEPVARVAPISDAFDNSEEDFFKGT